MTIKLKHGEEFHRSFKAIMDESRREREEQVLTLESYKQKMMEDLINTKRDVMTVLQDHR